MLELAGLALLGFAVGAFGTLVGAGGGFILVPILLLIYPDLPPETITAISLLVVFANTSSGSAAYAWQRRVDFASGIAFALATLPGAIGGALMVGLVPRRAFDGIFALVLVLAGAYLLRPRPAGGYIQEPLVGRGVIRRAVRDREGESFAYSYRLWQGLLISAGVGLMSSFLGTGGGIIHVPMMVLILRFPVHIATATSHFVIAMMALEATIVHVATGTLGWDRSLARGVALGLGAVVGAQLGAHLSRRVGGQVIIRALGLALMIVAIRLGVVAFFGS